MAGSNETKAYSAQFQVKLQTGAELGNKILQLGQIADFPSNLNKILSISSGPSLRKPNIANVVDIATHLFEIIFYCYQLRRSFLALHLENSKPCLDLVCVLHTNLKVISIFLSMLVYL